MTVGPNAAMLLTLDKVEYIVSSRVLKDKSLKGRHALEGIDFRYFKTISISKVLLYLGRGGSGEKQP